MPAPELKIKNRTAYYRKAVTSPDFESERVLVHDAFEYAELWLSRKCKDALPNWKQAKTYFEASQNLPPASAPLTLYYSFLNAVKALLIVKGESSSPYHGVTGDFISSKRALQNEIITFHSKGVIGALSRYFQEKEQSTEHTLKAVLSNLPFIHRAFRHTYTSHPDVFIPLRNLVYRKTLKDNYVWLSADVVGRFRNKISLKTLPAEFEHDLGYTKRFGYPDRCVIRSKKRIKWISRSASNAEYSLATQKLRKLHRETRRNISYISASPHLWYIKRNMAKAIRIDRENLTLMISAMHRLSELSRYDPGGLMKYLESQSAWLLTEFIRLAPLQFVDELVCEMTNQEFALPGIRPTST